MHLLPYIWCFISCKQGLFIGYYTADWWLYTAGRQVHCTCRLQFHCRGLIDNINSALNDSLDILKLHSDYLFAYILIYNRKFHNTHTYINTSSKSPHTFNYINFNINTPTNVQSDISFNNITLKGNDTKFLYKFSNNDYNFTEGYLNIISWTVLIGFGKYTFLYLEYLCYFLLKY